MPEGFLERGVRPCLRASCAREFFRQALADERRCARMSCTRASCGPLTSADHGQLDAQVAQPLERSGFNRQHPLAREAAHGAIIVVQRPAVVRMLGHVCPVVGCPVVGLAALVIALSVLAVGLPLAGLPVVGMVMEQSAERVGRQIGRHQPRSQPAMSTRIKHA
jgi:hypothetical protein